MNTCEVLVNKDGLMPVEAEDPNNAGYINPPDYHECGKPASIQHNGVWYCADHYDKLYDERGDFLRGGLLGQYMSPMCPSCHYQFRWCICEEQVNEPA
jgi:hypothetical protein